MSSAALESKSQDRDDDEVSVKVSTMKLRDLCKGIPLLFPRFYKEEDDDEYTIVNERFPLSALDKKRILDARKSIENIAEFRVWLSARLSGDLRLNLHDRSTRSDQDGRLVEGLVAILCESLTEVVKGEVNDPLLPIRLEEKGEQRIAGAPPHKVLPDLIPMHLGPGFIANSLLEVCPEELVTVEMSNWRLVDETLVVKNGKMFGGLRITVGAPLLADLNTIEVDEEVQFKRVRVWRFERFLLTRSTVGAQRDVIHQLSFFPERIVQNAIQLAFKNLIGSELLHEKLGNCLFQFASNEMPRGIILHGPSGSGKTEVVKLLARYLGLVPLYPPLTAGHFEQGIVGDTKRMFDEFMRRADLISWCATYIAIDEIDGLAPDRRNSNDHRTNALSVLLGMISGITDVHGNLVFLGSTNMLQKMEIAFLRRMHVKIFLGLPTLADRNAWLDKACVEISGAARTFIDPRQAEDIINVRSVLARPELRTRIQQWTMNYSHSAMRIFINRLKLCAAANRYKVQRELTDEEVWQVAVDVCESEKIQLGKTSIPVLLKDGESQRLQKYVGQLHKAVCESDKQRYQILIDLTAHAGEEIQTRGSVDFFSKPSTGAYLSDALFSEWEKVLKSYNRMMALNMLIKLSEQGIFQSRENSKLLAAFESYYPTQCDHQRFVSCALDYQSCLLGGGSAHSSALPTYKAHEFAEALRMFEKDEKLVNEFIKRNEQMLEDLNEITPIPCDRLSSASASGTHDRKQRAVQLLLNLAIKLEATSVQLFDAAHLMSVGATKEEDATQALAAMFEECCNYDKALLVIDLDSCVGVVKQLSGLKSALEHSGSNQITNAESETLTYTLQRSNMLLSCVETFKLAGERGKYKCWVALIGEDPYVVSRTKDKLGWDTPEDSAQKQREEENSKCVRCVRCAKLFDKHTNSTNECGTHIGKIVLTRKEREGSTAVGTGSGSGRDGSTGKFVKFFSTWQECEKWWKSKTELPDASREKYEFDAKWDCCGKAWYEVGELQEHEHTDR